MSLKRSIAPKGYTDSVGIEEYRGKYRLNLSRKHSRAYFGVDQKRISTGLSITPENFAAIEAKAQTIHLDTLTDNFDKSLVKYGLEVKVKPLQLDKPSNEQKALTLAELWDKFCEVKKNKLAETTYLYDYRGKMVRLIKEFPTQYVNRPSEIENWLYENKKPHGVKFGLGKLSQMCRWAVNEGLLTKDYYHGKAADVDLSRGKPHDTDIDWDEAEGKDAKAFTREEMGAIIEAYEHLKLSHYASLVKFLFWTGCRSGESAALRWGDVRPDFSVIIFRRSYSYHTGIFKETKTGNERIFPCGDKLKQLLVSIRPDNPEPKDLVFCKKFGGVIRQNDFRTTWAGKESNKVPGVLPRLIKAGKVRHYLKPYAARATFITLQVQEGGIPIDVVADWVGNSPQVIKSHYFDTRAQEMKPVDF